MLSWFAEGRRKAEIIYILCAATSTLCALLLSSAYRARRTRLLFYGSLGFAGIAVNNLLLLVDLAMVPGVDLSLPRSLAALAGIAILLHGLVDESR
jgi:hypothetical protein